MTDFSAELTGIFIWAGFGLLVLSGMVIGACLHHLWINRKQTCRPQTPHNPQSGNVFFAMFAVVGMVALLGTAMTTLVKGPATSVSNVTRANIAQNDMQAAVAVIAQASLVAPDGDCDDDGMIEPVPFRDAGVMTAPSGGGLLPYDVGVNRRDPWGTDYGYCVWDHGEKILDAACGGADSNRRAGGDTREAAAIAVISAGPDKIFQTACDDWTDNDTPVVTKISGSDDVMRIIPYAQMLSASGGNAKLQELPDEACTESTIGIMRLFLESPQICLEDGWTEIGGVAVQSAGDFVNVTGAAPASAGHLSGSISFSGFRGTRPLTVQGGASLLINGNPASSPAAISAGDMIELRADAPPSPGQTSAFSIVMSGIRKDWTIATRAKYPPNLTITPNAAAMSVVGPGNPAYSALTGFVVRNMGEQATGTLQAAQLSPLTHYEFSGSGDECGGVQLEPHAESSAQCILDIRAKSSGGAIPSGTLTVTDGGSANATATLSGTANGFGCTLGGVTVNHGGNRDFFSATSHTNCASVRLNRTCTNGTLSGSGTYQYVNCNSPSGCTLDGVSIAHGDSIDAFMSQNDPYCNPVQRTCSNGVLTELHTYKYAGCCKTAHYWVEAATTNSAYYVQVPWMPTPCGDPLGERVDYCRAKESEFAANAQAINIAQNLCNTAIPVGNATSCSYKNNSITFANNVVSSGGTFCPDTGNQRLTRCRYNFICKTH